MEESRKIRNLGKQNYPPPKKKIPNRAYIDIQYLYVEQADAYTDIDAPPPLPWIYKINSIVKLPKIAPESTLPANKIGPRTPYSEIVHAISLIL